MQPQTATPLNPFPTVELLSTRPNATCLRRRRRHLFQNSCRIEVDFQCLSTIVVTTIIIAVSAPSVHTMPCLCFAPGATLLQKMVHSVPILQQKRSLTQAQYRAWYANRTPSRRVGKAKHSSWRVGFARPDPLSMALSENEITYFNVTVRSLPDQAPA